MLRDEFESSLGLPSGENELPLAQRENLAANEPRGLVSEACRRAAAVDLDLTFAETVIRGQDHHGLR